MATSTLEQQRALYALEQIQKHKGELEERRYATLARSLGSMVLHNGLGQACAYLLADAGGPQGNNSSGALCLYRELQEWLVGEPTLARPERVYASDKELINALMDGSRQQYLQAQRCTLDLLAWMRKFTDAYLQVSD